CAPEARPVDASRPAEGRGRRRESQVRGARPARAAVRRRADLLADDRPVAARGGREQPAAGRVHDRRAGGPEGPDQCGPPGDRRHPQRAVQHPADPVDRALTPATPSPVRPVAYAGEPGAFAEDAVLAAFGDVDRVPLPGFRGVFESVAGGASAAGVVPIENVINGTVRENYDLLLEHDLEI